MQDQATNNSITTWLFALRVIESAHRAERTSFLPLTGMPCVVRGRDFATEKLRGQLREDIRKAYEAE